MGVGMNLRTQLREDKQYKERADTAPCGSGAPVTPDRAPFEEV
jgi:hypothetical protein